MPISTPIILSASKTMSLTSSMKTVLITGAEGRLGRELSSILLRNNCKVIAIDRLSSPFEDWANYSHLQCTLEKRTLITSVMRGSRIDALVHLAYTLGNDCDQVSSWEKRLSRETDKWLYRTAVLSEISKIILLSAADAQVAEEAGKKLPRLNGGNLYGKYKLASERALKDAVKKSLCRDAILRPTTLYLQEYLHPLAVQIAEKELLPSLTLRGT